MFNGDFVDRGKKGLEVLLLLLCTFLVFPGGVFLNRGNHEDTVMNARYGFIREVHQKYKHNAERLLKLIDEVYRWLPLGTIVNNRVLVVHGGISDSTDLDLIRSLDRGKVSWWCATCLTIIRTNSRFILSFPTPLTMDIPMHINSIYHYCGHPSPKVPPRALKSSIRWNGNR